MNRGNLGPQAVVTLSYTLSHNIPESQVMYNSLRIKHRILLRENVQRKRDFFEREKKLPFPCCQNYQPFYF